jgi:hypothetical protein
MSFMKDGELQAQQAPQAREMTVGVDSAWGRFTVVGPELIARGFLGQTLTIEDLDYLFAGRFRRERMRRKLEESTLPELGGDLNEPSAKQQARAGGDLDQPSDPANMNNMSPKEAMRRAYDDVETSLTRAAHILEQAGVCHRSAMAVVKGFAESFLEVMCACDGL